MFAKAYLLWKRQGGGTFGNDGTSGGGYESYDDGDDEDYGQGGESWWWTPAGMAVRYAIVALLFAFLLFYFIGGYYHARRRLRKGQQPLPYHRWMVQHRAYDSETRYAQYQQPGQTYVMDHYAPPPPAYTSAEAPLPVYQPPQGGSKVMADQSYMQARPADEASGGTGPAAPPTAVRQ